MAEEERARDHSQESVKLFVGQLPKQMTEEQLMEMFEEFAVIDQVNIIKDKTTRASRGCCFLICPSREEADKAITAYHNKLTLPGASSPLQVKYADGELERLEHKLFVGMLPKNVSDPEVSALFSQYGTIIDLQILRDSHQASRGTASRGYAFLKYEKKEQAIAAVEALNGKHTMEGATVPLVVKWADTEMERQARRAQKALSQSSNASNSGQYPSLYGSLSVGYMPPYNGYTYQNPGTHGLLPYCQLSVQNQPSFRNMVPSISQGGGIAPGLTRGISPRNYAMLPGSYLASAYRAVQGLQYPTCYPGGITGYQPPYTANWHSAASSSGSNTGGHVEGPAGANLFIYHIPQEFGDQELANTFQPFGTVLSAKVFVDKATGVSKCFGFVSYDSPDAAQSAIEVMNGFQLDRKKLIVQLKRENKQNKPY